jgi:hypothetical protein
MKQITFTYHNSIPVSLLISRDDIKIRLQSLDLSSLWFILQSLVKRLNDLYSAGKGNIITNEF